MPQLYLFQPWIIKLSAPKLCFYDFINPIIIDSNKEHINQDQVCTPCYSFLSKDQQLLLFYLTFAFALSQYELN